MKVQYLIFFYLLMVQLYSGLEDDSKIYFGTPVMDRGMFPFIVSIMKKRDEVLEKICTGSILTKDVVLSACQCFVNFTGSFMEYPTDPELSHFQVWAGTLTLSHNEKEVGEQERRINMLILAPECRDTEMFGYEYDFALIMLNNPLSYNLYVQPMPVGGNDKEERIRVLDDTIENVGNCTVMGWGRLVPERLAKDFPPFSNSLFYGTVKLKDRDKCFFNLCQEIGELVICIDRWQNRKDLCGFASEYKAAAPGDNGSPLFCDGFVVGIMGYGTELFVNKPRLFSPIYDILDIFSYSG